MSDLAAVAEKVNKQLASVRKAHDAAGMRVGNDDSFSSARSQLGKEYQKPFLAASTNARKVMNAVTKITNDVDGKTSNLEKRVLRDQLTLIQRETAGLTSINAAEKDLIYKYISSVNNSLLAERSIITATSNEISKYLKKNFSLLSAVGVLTSNNKFAVGATALIANATKWFLDQRRQNKMAALAARRNSLEVTASTFGDLAATSGTPSQTPPSPRGGSTVSWVAKWFPRTYEQIKKNTENTDKLLAIQKAEAQQERLDRARAGTRSGVPKVKSFTAQLMEKSGSFLKKLLLPLALLLGRFMGGIGSILAFLGRLFGIKALSKVGDILGDLGRIGRGGKLPEGGARKGKRLRRRAKLRRFGRRIGGAARGLGRLLRSPVGRAFGTVGGALGSAGLVAGAGVAGYEIGTAIYNWMDKTGINTKIFDMIDEAREAIPKKFGELKDAIVGMWGKVTTSIKDAWSSLVDRFVKLKDQIANVFTVEGATAIIKSLWDSARGASDGTKAENGTPIASAPRTAAQTAQDAATLAYLLNTKKSGESASSSPAAQIPFAAPATPTAGNTPGIGPGAGGIIPGPVRIVEPSITRVQDILALAAQ